MSRKPTDEQPTQSAERAHPGSPEEDDGDVAEDIVDEDDEEGDDEEEDDDEDEPDAD